MLDSEIITIIGYAVPLVITVAVLVYHKIYASLPKDVQNTVNALANVVVPSVEQSAGMLVGPAKKQEAVRILGEILASFGLKGVSPALIDAAIEAAVYALNQGTMTASTQRIPILK